MRDKYLGCWDLKAMTGRLDSTRPGGIPGCCVAAGLSPVSLTRLPARTPGHRSGDGNQSLTRGRSQTAGPARRETPTSGRADSTASQPAPGSEAGFLQEVAGS